MDLRGALVMVSLISVGCSGPGVAREAPAAIGPAALAARQRTAAVPHDSDDPAIWVHPTDATRSLILGTDKIEANGGLYVFGLDGALKQSVAPIDRPNNVDVEYGVRLGSRTLDVAVLTERKRHRLRVFRIEPDGSGVRDLAPEGVAVLTGETGEASEPMGIALYRRPSDDVLFAIVAPKTGDSGTYLKQYRIDLRGDVLTATEVRRFGAFSRIGAEPGEIGEIEAVVVDDELGFVYYSDERSGIRKYHADPEHPDAARELAVFGTSGYAGDREGLAIYRTGPGTGFIVSSDQVAGGSRLHLYRREGGNGPHDHAALAVVPTVADETDGLDVTDLPLPGYPQGLLVMMNSVDRNFLLFDWAEVIASTAATARTPMSAAHNPGRPASVP